MKINIKHILVLLLLGTSCTDTKKSTEELKNGSPLITQQIDTNSSEKKILIENADDSPYIPIFPNLSEKKNIVKYLKHFQTMMINSDVEGITAETEFPLLGDCVYYMIWGEKYFENTKEYEGKIDSKAFREGFKGIFDNEYISIIKKVRFDSTTPILEEETVMDYQTQKDKEGRYHSVRVHIWGEENNFELSISSIDPVESINEHSKKYHFKKAGDTYKLFLINCAG